MIPLVEVVGNGANASPEQIGATGLNKGTPLDAFTTIVMVAVVAHCPAVGVKVYNVVFVLSKGGDQFPVIPFKEVVGKAEIVAPGQTAGTAVNVGTTG